MLIELQTVLDLIERRVKEIEDTGDIRPADETLVQVNTLRMLSLSIRVHCAAPEPEPAQSPAPASSATDAKSVTFVNTGGLQFDADGITIPCNTDDVDPIVEAGAHRYQVTIKRLPDTPGEPPAPILISWTNLTEAQQSLLKRLSGGEKIRVRSRWKRR